MRSRKNKVEIHFDMIEHQIWLKIENLCLVQLILMQKAKKFEFRAKKYERFNQMRLEQCSSFQVFFLRIYSYFSPNTDQMQSISIMIEC